MIMTKRSRRMEQTMLRSCTCLAIFGASRSAELLQGKALLRRWSWRCNLDITVSIDLHVVYWGQTRKIGSRSHSNDLRNSDACWNCGFGHDEWISGFLYDLWETLEWEILMKELCMIRALLLSICTRRMQSLWSEFGTMSWLAIPFSLSADSGFCHFNA